MVDVRELGSLQLDGLREVANIGGGHAATALSQLMNHRIMVGVPTVRVLRIDEIADMLGTGETVVAGVAMQMLGDLTGRTVQIFPKETAERVTATLTGRKEVTFPDGFGELEQSALKEVGNILSGAYLNALSEFLGLLLLTSVPGLAMDATAAVLKSSFLEFNESRDYVFLVETIFNLDEVDHPLHGHFMLVPDEASIDVLLRAIRLA
ncbi:MAG TPA: chemotaxis protein CheC [Longimicrobiales bacterium]|nr:chemotaxis protein CheC [Longimicrobiales bacterium]